LTRELEAVGLRLNQTPPQIYIKAKHSGGVQVNNVVPGGLTRMTDATAGILNPKPYTPSPYFIP